MFRFDALNVYNIKDLKSGIKKLFLGKYGDLLPSDRNAKILIKPNLNSNMNALTGNTTDLRLLSAVIELLKENGYQDITIGEGTNSGFYRNNISVISRLKVDALADYYDVSVKDLNYSKTVEVKFEKGVKACVAKECIEADLFINMPKLKTHFENGMSVCLKNLMGCLVGQENKKKTHKSLEANILNINKFLKPHLHIVDAIFSMEGLGPTRGTPIKTGMVLIGTDPYLIDLMCAKLASFNHKKVRTLVESEKRGIVNSQHHKFVNEFQFEKLFKFAPPKAGPIATFIHSPKRQKYFLAVRNTPVFNFLCSTELGGKLLYRTGLRQDVFIKDEMECTRLSVDMKRCTQCGKCSDYCPSGLTLPDVLAEEGELNPKGNRGKKCLFCLYCFCACPENAIAFHGKLGFMEEQMKQYGEIIKKIVREE